MRAGMLLLAGILLVAGCNREAPRKEKEKQAVAVAPASQAPFDTATADAVLEEPQTRPVQDAAIPAGEQG